MSVPPAIGSTIAELRGEGRLLSAVEARRRMTIHRQRARRAERDWLAAHPWVVPLVWTGGEFREFLSQADDASIRAAFYGEHAPVDARQRRLAQVELRQRAGLLMTAEEREQVRRYRIDSRVHRRIDVHLDWLPFDPTGSGYEIRVLRKRHRREAAQSEAWSRAYPPREARAR